MSIKGEPGWQDPLQGIPGETATGVVESPNQATGSLTKNAYYDAITAVCGLSTSLTYSEEYMAEFANILAEMLDSIYEDANKKLSKDADNVANTKSDDQSQDQNTYSNDSTYYQNLETEYNSMVDAANTSTNNLANAQSQLTQLASTLNGDGLYMSNLLAQPLSG